MTAPATDSLSGIVGRLSPETRQAILGCRWHETEWPISYDAHANGEYCCERHATELGIAIRQHMEKES